MTQPSTRAELLTQSKYCRPKETGGFESWEEVIQRVIGHQQWLWERAANRQLNENEFSELQEFAQLMRERKACPSGRTLWLGGTSIAQTRESSMFNCSFTNVETVYDFVDAFWLLLQGCGVGFKPVRGTLNGFRKVIPNIEVIRSKKILGERGDEKTVETVENGVWTIKLGDSAKAWARSIGKILAGKHDVHTLVFDFSEIRCAGERLKGYGWISSGDEAISKAYLRIANLMNARAGMLLTAIDILDIMNHLGTVLSSRRSAQICILDADDLEAREFALAKKDYWSTGKEQRGQSNNSIVFYRKPSKKELKEIFSLMERAGGSEPGFINGQTAMKRAPWFAGVNPCCFTGDMELLTTTGYKTFKELAGSSVELINTDGQSVKGSVWSTGVKEIVLVKFAGQQPSITCTPDHRFLLADGSICAAKDLKGLQVKQYQSELGSLVVDVLPAGEAEVFDFNEPKTNLGVVRTIVVHNCEILLGNKCFCNLTEIDLGKFIGEQAALERAIYITARTNYRQTLVNLRDGILQEAWHLNNEFLRLCGVGLTGIVQRPDLHAYDYKNLERIATSSAYSMADELGTQRPKNVTTVKPSGTLSKIMDTTEGVHKPLGKYIFNNVIFSNHDENLPILKEAGYNVFPHPFDTTSSIVTFPVCWDNVPFETVNGVEVNTESAIAQLERYKLLQTNYVQQNTSVTISYSPNEVPKIIDWLLANWEHYVGVSFLYRTDPTKTAKDLGYAYLPQEVVTKETYEEYVAKIKPVNLRDSLEDVDAGGECGGGSCPLK